MSKPSEKLEALFEAAVALPTAAQRADYLSRACHDPELRREVESLLAAHENPDQAFAEKTIRVEPKIAENAGRVIGRYKLLELLGEGGFGTVWAAEQKEPVRRRVALKIIKLGMDTKQVVARFEAERQALAVMDHPNIAKVLDAGSTDTGRPYFVMELVRGVRITDYCDQGALSTRERLDLFIKVCQAIQHAHQKGIIHRDIKPSNVLVTLHDGVPVPKVIDFGIAKATQAELTEKTIYTQHQQFIGTPAYMSPEQAEMSGLDLDTRSDIYSLGVLLYELLTGKPPFEAERLLASGLDEMRRILREVEPVKPSRVVERRSELRVEGQDQRSSHPGRTLNSQPKTLSTDLDWIVMKALEKDRARRYETANGLAADIKRHLNSEPVVARPPSTAYRVQKFVRRNKAAVAAAALVTVLLVAGVIGTSLGFFQAQGEKRRAVLAARDAQAAQREAQTARDLAEDNANKLAENLYFNRVALAHRELTSEPSNIREAEQLLELCPRAIRDWEWHFLKRFRLVEPLVLADPESKEVYSIAFSPDGRHLASAGGLGKVRIWDLDQRRLVRTLDAHTNFVFAIGFHPTDPARLVSAGADRQVNYWDWKTGTLLHTWQGHFAYEYGAAYSVAFSPDGRRLAAMGKEGVANVWDTKTFENVLTLAGHELAAISVAFSADGKWIATGSHHGIVRLWDAAIGGLRREMGEYGPPISCVAFSHDSSQLAASSFDESVRLWNVASAEREPRRHFRAHSSLALGVAFSADDRRLATTGLDRVVALWDSASDRQVLALRDLASEGFCVRFSPEGHHLAAGSGNGTIHVWDATPLDGASDQSLLTLPFSRELWAMDISPATNWIAFAGDRFGDPKLKEGPERKSAPVTIYQTGTDRFVRELVGHSVIVFSLAFDPTGRFLASSGDEPRRLGNGTIKVWDLTTGTEAFPIEDIEENGVLFSVAYSKDGRRLVGAGADRVVKVWDGRTGRKIGVLGGHQREILMLAFSPDGRHLATAAADRTVKLWDATRLDERQEARLTLATARGDVASTVAFSPNSARLVVAVGDHSARIWDAATGIGGATLESRAHQFLSLAFSPDGRRVASGGTDCTVKLWDAQTGRWLHTFRGHTGAITRTAFVQRSEGLRLISASRDHTVKYWDVTAIEK